MNIILADETATLALGAALAPCMSPGLVVYLEGDLGAGKTTMVRGLLRALSDSSPVKSPTYTLVEIHVVSGLNFYHFDFYRFSNPEEYLDAGLEEYFDGNGICLVEWPAQAAPYLPEPDLVICLAVDKNRRVADVQATSPGGERCLTNFVPPAAMSTGSPPPP